MSILSGFKKVRRRMRLPDGYKLLSFWTSSQTVEMDDGTTLESNKAKWDDMSTNINTILGKKANQSELDTHVNNSTIHITANERTKLSGIAEGANKYTHSTSAAGAKANGLYKITTDANGHVTEATTVTKTDITNLGIPGQDTNTTYSQATSSTLGLTKLYTSAGTSTDGTMTRNAISNELKKYTPKSWAFVQVTGTNSIDITNLVTNSTEIIVEVYHPPTRITYTYSILTQQLNSTLKALNNGYYWSSTNYSLCQILISNSRYNLANCKANNNAEYRDACISTLYYR